MPAAKRRKRRISRKRATRKVTGKPQAPVALKPKSLTVGAPQIGAPQLLQRAREVNNALRKLPANAPLAQADRQNIRRALSILTNGQVGGVSFKHKDPKAAKRKAWQTLKHYAGIVADKAAEQVGKRLGDAVVMGALWEALRRLLE
jgi:hypothetical protein